MNKHGDYSYNCSNPDCECNKPRAFWVQLDDNGNPIDICWSYYPGDRPMIGNWIKVREEK
jgi:hypothetical protein